MTITLVMYSNFSAPSQNRTRDLQQCSHRSYTMLTCQNALLYYVFYVFLCLECSCMYLYCIPVMQCCHFSGIFNIAAKCEVSLATKSGKIHPFFIKCPVQSQEYGSCYQIIRFYVCCIVACFCYTSGLLWLRWFWFFFHIVEMFPWVLVCNPDLFSLNLFMTFETAVYYCCQTLKYITPFSLKLEFTRMHNKSSVLINYEA